MSQLFVPTGVGFEVQPLDAGCYRIYVAAASLLRVEPPREESAAGSDALLVRGSVLSGGSSPAWFVCAHPAARILVNGEPLDLGIALLRHRDELRLPGAAPLYFSAERFAKVEPCTRTDSPRCPRCAQPIACGEPAVCCPACDVLHHQLPDRPCWSHLPRCGLCERATDLDAGLSWTPEEL